MRKGILVIAALTGGLLAASPAMARTNRSMGARVRNRSTSQRLSGADKAFLIKVAHGNNAEIQLAQLALKTTQNDAVRKAAQTILNDHQTAGKTLQSVAGRKGLSLPGGPDQAHKGIRDRLSKVSGRDFDNAYVANQLHEHKATIALFNREIRQSRDPAVRSFAKNTLPHLKVHEALLLRARRSVRTTASAGGAPTNRSM